jgi:hypothetical protein
MWPLNISFLKEVRLKEQGWFLIIPKKNIFICLLYYNYSNSNEEFMQSEKKEGRVCHLRINLSSCLYATPIVPKEGSIESK